MIFLKPAFPVLLAFASVFFILLVQRRRRGPVVLATSLLCSGLVLSIFRGVLGGAVFEASAPSFLSGYPYLTLVFRADPLGVFFALITSLMWIPITVYTMGLVSENAISDEGRFYVFSSIAFGAGMGLGLAGNLFTFFVFYEILSISLYPLVIHSETDASGRAGRRYIFYSLFGGVLLFLSTLSTYRLVGDITFSAVGVFNGTYPTLTLTILFISFALGFAVKSAVMPFHGWLPQAMAAPIPANAVFVSVEAGVFGFARLVYNIYGPALVRDLNLWLPLAIAAAVTIIVASFYAIIQDDLKQRLAYSTVSQLSYVVLGIALLGPSAGVGGLIHIAHQAVMKTTLFFAAGAIFLKTGKTRISEFRGLASQMPLTMAAFSVAALGVIGFPPFAGFITKWYLATGSLEAGQTLFLLVILGSTFLNAIYFLPPIYIAFSKDLDMPTEGIGDPNLLILAPMLATALYVILLGMLPNLPYGPLKLVEMAVSMFFGG